MATPRKASRHVVAPGDHLSRVAATNGFRSYVPLADDAENAPLMQLRKTPHILAVGDPVDIPPLEGREVERSTEQRHRFHATIPALVVRITHRTWAGAPIAPPDTVQGDGKALEVTASGADTFTVPVSPLTDRVTFTAGTRDIRARVGFLQAIATLAGARERLTNLGYDAGDSDDPTNLQLRSAVEEFQCDQHLAVDGRIGPDTRARLVKVHGC